MRWATLLDQISTPEWNQTLVALSNAFAGASASAIAMTLFYPLENIRTRLQAQIKLIDDEQSDDPTVYTSTLDCVTKIIETEGIAGLYRGVSGAVVGVTISAAVYFYWYNLLKNTYLYRVKLRTGKNVSIGPWQNIIIAMVAGTINCFQTNPLWVIQTRMTLQEKRHGIYDVFRHMIKEEGIMSLYSGLLPSLFLVINPIIQFVCYEQFSRLFNKPNKPKRLNNSVIFAFGAVSKSIATVLTYPLQVVKTRLQAKVIVNDVVSDNVVASSNKSTSATSSISSLTTTGKRRTIVDLRLIDSPSHDLYYSATSTMRLVHSMYKHEGIQCFFQGMHAKLFQTVTTSAFMFVFYERILAYNVHLFTRFLAEAQRRKMRK